VIHDGRVYVAGGGDYWWGKLGAWIHCIDGTGRGDITRSGRVWSAELGRHVFSTPAIHEGLVYIADTRKRLHCLDARDGTTVWTHDADGEFWASPHAADGKIFIGSRRGEVLVLAAGREKKVLGESDVEDPISATVTTANGTAYVTSMTRIYAVADTPPGAPAAGDPPASR
jgi:outer membrane protein assembly factor BamB